MRNGRFSNTKEGNDTSLVSFEKFLYGREYNAVFLAFGQSFDVGTMPKNDENAQDNGQDDQRKGFKERYHKNRKNNSGNDRSKGYKTE